MFKTHPNVVKLAPEVYLYRNFLSEQELSRIAVAIKSLEELGHWLNKDKYDDHSVIPAPNQVFQGSESLNLLYEKTHEFFSPEYLPLPSNGISKMIEGQSLEVHWDSPAHPDDDHEETEKEFFARKEKGILYDPLDTCHIVQYGYVVYVSDFEGGELYYTDIDLEFAPQKGDLIIHSASRKYKHGVKPVTKGPRYAYTNFVTLAKDSPMTLEEYLEEEHVTEMKNEAIAKGINAPAF
jgi:hypothetical protein